MLLALDVGNTSITLGLFRGRRLVRTGRIPTHGADYRRALSRWRSARTVEAVVISSVVPGATVLLKKALRGLKLPRPLVLGEDLEAPVINRYRIPSQVGQDRLCNAAAAYFLYGGPAIVVDFGTAVTIDLVSGRREYLGGLIVPGVAMGLEALTERTALLPEVELRPPKEFLGRDTCQSMLSGVFFGYGALCDGIVARMRTRHAPGAKVIATGGHAGLLSPFSKSVQMVNPDLTLQGLRITYDQVRKRGERGERSERGEGGMVQKKA